MLHKIVLHISRIFFYQNTGQSGNAASVGFGEIGFAGKDILEHTVDESGYVNSDFLELVHLLYDPGFTLFGRLVSVAPHLCQIAEHLSIGSLQLTK
jgi:hypothetical protein